MTITVSVNCQISYRLLKFKDLKSTFLLTFIEGWPLDFIFIVCVFLVLFYSTSFNFPMDVIGDTQVLLVSFNFKY